MDDNADARYVLSAMLNFDGYEAVVAQNGVDGVHCARECVPDLILMDLRMPLMDGFEATAALRAEEQTRFIPIIAISAEPDDVIRRSQDDELFVRILRKPLTAAVIEESVRGVIGGP